MMISFALRALIVLAVGFLGDVLGLHQAYLISAALALLGLPFLFMLPPSKPLRAEATGG